MSYSYDLTRKNDVDKLRLMIPDRIYDGYDPPAMFEDEELEMLREQYGDLFRTAAGACEIIAMDMAKQAIAVSLPVGMSINKGQVPSYFLQRAKTLYQNSVDSAYEVIDSFDYYINKFGYDLSEYDD
jgi:hypothetical protein